MAVAEMNDIDLDSEIERKIAKNVSRVYRRNAEGILIRTSETNDMSDK
jgi:hypothetical protein